MIGPAEKLGVVRKNECHRREHHPVGDREWAALTGADDEVEERCEDEYDRSEDRKLLVVLAHVGRCRTGRYVPSGTPPVSWWPGMKAR